MAKRKTKKKSTGGLSLVLVGAAAAASAGAYYLYGPKGRKHRKQVRGWTLKASGEVLDKAEKLREIDKDKYYALVDQVSKKYKKIRNIDNKDIVKLQKDLRAQWAHIEREAKKGKAAGKRAVAKGKITAKKTKKKATRKVHKVATKVAKKTAPKKRKK